MPTPSTTEAKIARLAEPVAHAHGASLWGVEIAGAGGGKAVRIYIEDGGDEPGVTIDTCAAVSRDLSVVLDTEDPLKGAYRLEVSSPGLDRLFFRLDQMTPYTGQMVDLHLYEPQDLLTGRKKYKATLATVDEDAGRVRVVDVDGHNHELDWDNVRSARLVPEEIRPTRPGK